MIYFNGLIPSVGRTYEIGQESFVFQLKTFFVYLKLVTQLITCLNTNHKLARLEMKRWLINQDFLTGNWTTISWQNSPISALSICPLWICKWNSIQLFLHWSLNTYFHIEFRAHNEIHSLSSVWLPRAKSLKNLDLSYNKIAEFPAGVFSNGSRLQVL